MSGILAIVGIGHFVRPALAESDWATGGAFSQVLDRWVSITVLDEGNTLRQTCGDFSRTQQVAIWIDRRLDPSAPVLLKPPASGTTREIFSQIADSQQATFREVGDALYLLPRDNAEKLKTLIALRTEKAPSVVGGGFNPLPPGVQKLKKILQRRAYHWESLQTPRNLAIQAAKQCDLTIKNPEAIPHDLWFQGTIPRAHLIEFLSLVLFQYDLTFEWERDAMVNLVPIPDQVEITRVHPLAEGAAVDLQARYPQSRWEKSGVRWKVTGPEDLHEAIVASRQRSTPNTGTPRVRWDERTFTMRVQRKPLAEVLNYLLSAGIPVHFQAEQLKQQGHNPEQLISFEVTSADAAGLFKAICEPIGVPYRLTSEQVLIGQETETE